MTPPTSDPDAANAAPGHASAATKTARSARRPTEPIVGSLGRPRQGLLLGQVARLRQVVGRDPLRRLLVDVDPRVELLHGLGRESLLDEVDRLARVRAE